MFLATVNLMRIFLILVLLACSTTSYGFGVKAHRVISNIAEGHLSEAARLQIKTILGDESLASVSTWADEMRYAQTNEDFWGYDYSANWHFVNIEANKNYGQSRKNNRGDAYLALLTFTAILENKEPNKNIITEGLEQYLGSQNSPATEAELKQLALKFLVHLIADLHQPLHVGFEEDQGGNQIEVRWFGRKTNLHSVWDSRLLNQQDLSARQLTRQYQQGISEMSDADIAKIEQALPIDWLNESLEIREEIYNVERFNSELNTAYAEEFTPLVNTQLIKAGLRLAATLNRIFE